MSNPGSEVQVVAGRKEVEFARADLQSPLAVQQATSLSILYQRATILAQSGFLPEAIDTPQKAAAIMMRADELEIDYWTALQHIHVIKGNPQPDGQLCLAMIQRSGLLERYEVPQSDDQTCTVIMKRRGMPVFSLTCTMREYEKVAGPDAKRQPKIHLFWYTIKQIARRLFSDVLNNMTRRRSSGPLLIDDDLPVDDGSVIEEGDYREDEPAAQAPLDRSSSAENASSSADGGSAEVTQAEDGEPVDVIHVGALDMNSLQERALRQELARNEWHFANLLKLLLADGAITERMTADQVLDVMRRRKAEKELAGETAVSE